MTTVLQYNLIKGQTTCCIGEQNYFYVQIGTLQLLTLCCIFGTEIEASNKICKNITVFKVPM